MKNRKRIIISVSSDICTDQRVQKVTSSLHYAGYDVHLIGTKTKKSGSCDAIFEFHRISMLFSKTFLFYAELNIRLFFTLLFKKADIFLSNDTDTLLANFLVSKIRSKKLVFDAHELFPEVPEVTNRAFVKSVWTKLESYIFPKLKYAYTVCDSIAQHYKELYGINMEVIRNVPYRKAITTKNQLDFGDKKIILYQGAVNIGRGLEWVIDAMPLIDNAILVIIGKGDIYHDLIKKVHRMHLRDKVHFLGKIKPRELPAYTQSADLGLCLLEENGLSYYYSLPNRIFDFMNSGVPILATDFPEINRIVATNSTGKLISHYEPEYLAEVIKETIDSQTEEDKERLKNLSKNFCWELEEQKLLAIFESLK